MILGWLRREKPAEMVLLSVVPPRTGERTLVAIENLLQALAVEEPFALELSGTADGVSFLVRTRSPDLVRQQLAIHYPQARIRHLGSSEDPLRLEENEVASTLILTLAAPEFLPLRTFRDDDFVDAGSDPLLAVLGALSTVKQNVRLMARLVLHALGPDWSEAYQRRALASPSSQGFNPSYLYQTRPLKMEGVGLILLMLALLVGLQNQAWLRDGHLPKAVLLDAALFVALVIALPILWRFLRGASRIYDNRLMQEKVSRAAFLAELQLIAVVPEGQNAEELLRTMATAYHHYDLASGNRFREARNLPGLPKEPLRLIGRRLWHGRSVLSTREVATLWHPPRGGDEVPLLERSGARSLHPLAKSVRAGAFVGVAASGGNEQRVHFTGDLLRQHHLYVAKTRMGKSTLMQHVIAHKLRMKAQGLDHDAIVVVDPHSDLVRSLLELVPREVVGQVFLVDLANPDRVPGINLLDTHLFPDRDRATDNVVHVVKNLWEQWGPRMQSILEHTLKSLYEANRHPEMERDRQYTILDGLHLLSDESFRKEVLSKVADPYLVRWWARDFRDWHRQYRADAVAPVQTRLAYYASSERARAILGQSSSTLALDQIITRGNVLLVSTAQGRVGRDVAALVGGTLLNLVDGVIRTQEALPADQRRRMLVVVDEMQAIPGADYEAMLSELGKFGASFIMATQSLARLEELGRTLRETIFANVGCLAAFQVSAADARYLAWEFDRDQVSEADLTSLPVHHCYVRATVGGEKLPTFSMALRPPEPGDPTAAEAVRERVAAYTQERQAVATRLERAVEQYVAEFRLDLVGAPLAAPPDGKPKTQSRRAQRSHRNGHAVRLAGDDAVTGEVSPDKNGPGGSSDRSRES